MTAFRDRKIVRSISALAKRVVLPGFDGLSVYEVSSFFFRGIWEGYIPTRASALAFNFFLALFPAILFLFTLIPYIPVTNFQTALFDLIYDVLPPNAYDAAKTTIDDVIHHGRSGLLSFGFFLALFFSTNGVSAMISEFNHTIHSNDTRSYLKQRWVALVLTVLLAFLLLIAIGLIVLSETFTEYLVERRVLENIMVEVISYGRWAIMLGLVFVSTSMLYYYAPSRKIRFRLFSAGSTLATILLVLTSAGFSYYVSNFAQYNKLYGSIGTLIVILLWIYFNSISLLLGFELNASITGARSRKLKREA